MLHGRLCAQNWFLWQEWYPRVCVYLSRTVSEYRFHQMSEPLAGQYYIQPYLTLPYLTLLYLI
jgi:hypothetical protein